MIRKLLENRMTLVVLWIAFLLFGFYLFNIGDYPNLPAMTNGLEPPEQVFGADWEYQKKFVERLGTNGTRIYSNFQILDYINASLVGLVFFATFYQILFRLKAARAFFVITVLPLCTAGSDFIENTLMLINLRTAPELGKGLSQAFSFFTNIKLIFGSATFLSFLILMVVFFGSTIFRRIRK